MGIFHEYFMEHEFYMKLWTKKLVMYITCQSTQVSSHYTINCKLAISKIILSSREMEPIRLNLREVSGCYLQHYAITLFLMIFKGE